MQIIGDLVGSRVITVLTVPVRIVVAREGQLQVLWIISTPNQDHGLFIVDFVILMVIVVIIVKNIKPWSKEKRDAWK